MKVVRNIISIFSSQSAFSDAAYGRDDMARKKTDIILSDYMNRNIDGNSSVIESSLLNCFLYMNLDHVKVRKSSLIFFSLSKKDKYFNLDEKLFMFRYLLSVIYFSRGENNSTILNIRKNIKFNLSNIRASVKHKFSSPDEKIGWGHIH